MILAHDVRTAYSHLKNVPGLERYPDRALAMAALAAVIEEGPCQQAYLDYLKAVGIGPKQVIVVRRLMEDMAHGHVADFIRRQARQGTRVQYFQPTQTEVAVAHELGLDWREHIFNPDLGMTRFANCKRVCRALAKHLGLDDAIVPYEECYTLSDALSAYRQLRRINGKNPPPDFIMLKVPNLASGDGMRRAFTEDDVVDFWRRYGVAAPIIVEAGYTNHFPLSMMWASDVRGARFRYATSQLIMPDGVTHAGNVVSTTNVHRLCSPADVAHMHRITLPMARMLQRHGYHGDKGFDLMRVPHPNGTYRYYLLEINGRVSGSQVHRSVAEQVARKVRKPIVARGRNLALPSGAPATFEELEQTVNGVLYRGDRDDRGVVPVLPGLLSQGKVQYVAVGPTDAVAQAVAEEFEHQMAGAAPRFN